jgi:large subunit ribosomal protein L4
MTMATTIDILDEQGTKSGSRELAAEIFDATVSVPLMHQVVVAGLAGLRAGTHSTKTRGDVAGGGRKPWRQKGTGRARQGSIRSPQWVGGGVAHGPHPRDHSMRVNKKMRKGALRSALTDALRSGKLAVVAGISIEEPKTKAAIGLLSSLELSGKVLVVLERPTTDGAIEKSFRNLADVKVAYAGGLGTYDVLWADRVLLTGAALDALEGSVARDQGSTPEANQGSPPEGGASS